MRHRVMAIVTVGLLFGSLDTAACAHAQAATPFQEVPLPQSQQRSYAWAYVALAAGVGCIGLSYTVENEADIRYSEYLEATDPDEISHLYDQTVSLDRLASASLFAGEALIATGLYLRFLRRAPTPRASLILTPDRCAFAWRF